MERLQSLCEQYGIALCYIFGSQQESGKDALEGKNVAVADPESDVDVAVLFRTPPCNPVEIYARLSMDLQDLLTPFKVDLLFLHEVDHLIQLEAIRGISAYAIDDETRDAYEHRVMALAADEIEIFKRNERDFLEAIRDGYFAFEYQAA
jgi:predicted nucleotidyltransferase